MGDCNSCRAKEPRSKARTNKVATSVQRLHVSKANRSFFCPHFHITRRVCVLLDPNQRHQSCAPRARIFTLSMAPSCGTYASGELRGCQSLNRPTTSTEDMLLSSEEGSGEKLNSHCQRHPVDDTDLISSDGSFSTEELDYQEHKEMMRDVLKAEREGAPKHFHRRRPSEAEIDLYRSKRKMTTTQEKWNAITMIPSPLFCLYYVLSGSWVQSSIAERSDVLRPVYYDTSSQSATPCLPQSRWHSMPAMPPLPVLAVAVAISLHAPFSFLYHWKFASTYGILHWSRRLDQSFIHVASALVSFATSGSWDYFCANALFNAECIYRLHLPRVRPRMNQVRIAISILAYVFPIFWRGDYSLFSQLLIVLGVGGWLFSAYPVGGWSHSAFHIVMCLLPPLIMEAASELPVSEVQMRAASSCLALTS